MCQPIVVGRKGLEQRNKISTRGGYALSAHMLQGECVLNENAPLLL